MKDQPTATYNVKQTASALGVSEKLVYRMVEQGEIPHLRISNRIVFPRHLFDEWLDEASRSAKKLAAPSAPYAAGGDEADHGP